MKRLENPQTGGRQQSEKSTVGHGTKTVRWQQVVGRLQKRSTLLFGVDVRNEPPMRGAEEVPRHNHGPRIELRTVGEKGPQDFEPTRRREECRTWLSLRPSHGQIERERAAMTGGVGKACKGK